VNALFDRAIEYAFYGLLCVSGFLVIALLSTIRAFISDTLLKEQIKEPEAEPTPLETGDGVAGIGILFLASLAIASIVFFLLPLQLRYAIQYHIPRTRVQVEDEPHECEFDKAPIGNKYCHYEKQVSKIKDDAGRTGGIFVSWNKVKE